MPTQARSISKKNTPGQKLFLFLLQGKEFLKDILKREILQFHHLFCMGQGEDCNSSLLDVEYQCSEGTHRL